MNTLVEWAAAILILTLFTLVAIGLGNALLGCTPVQVERPHVTLIDPELPTIKASELRCLSNDVWNRVAMRELQYRFAYEQCRLVVKELTK